MREKRRRGKQEKQEKQAIMQWLMPIALFLLIIVILLVNFSFTSKRNANERVEEQLKSVTAQYAYRCRVELDTMTKAGKPVGEMLYHAWTRQRDKTLVVQMLESLQKNTASYQVIASDLKGHGITNAGEEVDLREETFFQDASMVGQKYVFAREGVSGREAIISALPISAEDTTTGYLFLFYPQERVRDLIRKVEFDNLGFYLLITEDGTIIEQIGTPSEFTKQDNLLDTLKSAKIYQDTYEKTKLRLSKLSDGMIGATYGGEQRLLVYAPLEINSWHLVVGVNQSYVTRQQEKTIRPVRAVVSRMIVALVLLLVMFTTIYVINKSRSDERGRELEDKADMDLLTELNNKMATERKIREYIEKHPNEQAMMCMLDIDNFKKINDTMGHKFGDEVIRSLGIELKAEFRVSDILGRTGGDEFMVFLTNIRDGEMVQREMKRLERFFHDFKAGEYVKYSVTASIGCSMYPKDATSFEELYQAADKAVYKAKRRGKNQIALYTEEDASIDLEAEKRKSRS